MELHAPTHRLQEEYNEGCTGCSGRADCFILNNPLVSCAYVSHRIFHSQIQVSNLVMQRTGNHDEN